MAATTQLRLFYLFHFSKPATDRPVYRAVHEGQIRRVLEVGIGSGERAKRIIEVAGLRHPTSQLYYTAIDLFEGKSAEVGPAMSLKSAYRLLHATGAKVRLLPGDPATVLSREANHLGPQDLVIVSAGFEAAVMEKIWFYLPRMLHQECEVFVEQRRAKGEDPVLRCITPAEVARLAQKATRRAA